MAAAGGGGRIGGSTNADGPYPERMSTLPPAAIFDIDGTLAIRGDREMFDWSAVDVDHPNPPVLEVARSLHLTGWSIVYLTGRSDESRRLTEAWLHLHVGVPGPLLMRSARDFRRDTVVKRELYDRHVVGVYDVRMVFEDRDQVVEMWRNEVGLPCFQVAPGDF